MKTLTRAVITSAAALLIGVSAHAADATEVKNEAFSIMLPAGFSEFKSQNQKSDSPNGPIDTTTWVSKAPTGEAVVVTMSDMPANITDPAKLFSSTRDSLVASLKAKIETEEAGTGDKPTMRLVFRGETAPVFLRSTLAVDADRFYQVLYVGRSEEQRAASPIAALFDSFQMMAAAPTAAPAVAPVVPAAAPAPAAAPVATPAG
jgi:hypothetical protein